MIRLTSRARGNTVTFLLFLCISLLYMYASAVSPYSWKNYYGTLGEGFLSGHTYLSVPVPPEVIALAEPYNPRDRKVPFLWDASLYQGHYYLYFGPTPALLVWIPTYVLTGIELSDQAITLILCITSIAALVLLLKG